jgi:hypothetical protein
MKYQIIKSDGLAVEILIRITFEYFMYYLWYSTEKVTLNYKTKHCVSDSILLK